MKIPTSSTVRVADIAEMTDYANAKIADSKYQRSTRRFRLKQRDEGTPHNEQQRYPVTNPSDINASNRGDSRLIDLQI